MVVVAPKSVDPAFCWGTIAIVGLNLLLVLFGKLSEPKPINWISAELIFATSFIIVHFLYIFMWLTEIFYLGQEIWYFKAGSYPHVVCKTLAMCAGCLSAFNLGYVVVKFRLRIAPIKPVAKWQTLGKLLVRFSLLMLVSMIFVVGAGRFWGGSYQGSNFGFGASILLSLFQGLVVASICVLMVSRTSLHSGRSSKKVFWFDLLLALGGSLAILLHGDRSTFLIIILAIVASYSEFVKPVKLRTTALAFVGLFLLLGVSGVARHAAEGRSFASFYRTAIESGDDSIEFAMKGFSGSVLTAFVAADYVPNHHPYFMGQLKTNSIAGLIPFGRKLFGVRQSTETDTAMLFTLLVHGKTGKGVAGAGTSVFADIYLEFGYWATAIIFCFMGGMYKTVSEKSKSTDNLLWKVALICLIGVSCISGRMAILNLAIRQVAYPVAYVAFFAWILGVNCRASRHVAVHPKP